MRAGRWLAPIALTLLAGAWGIFCTLGPGVEPAAIQAAALGPEDGESVPVLRPGETADSSMSFTNHGLTGCRLRVRVCGPQIGGLPVLEPGHIGPEGFTPSGTADSGEGEYWTAKGAYLYYKNSRTGDLLPPGRETPPLYTAVRMNALIDPEALAALRDIDPQQQLYVLAQAQPEGGGPWQEAAPPA